MSIGLITDIVTPKPTETTKPTTTMPATTPMPTTTPMPNNSSSGHSGSCNNQIILSLIKLVEQLINQVKLGNNTNECTGERGGRGSRGERGGRGSHGERGEQCSGSNGGSTCHSGNAGRSSYNGNAGNSLDLDLGVILQYLNSGNAGFNGNTASSNGSPFSNAGSFNGTFAEYAGKQTHAAADLKDVIATFSQSAALGKGTGTGLDSIVSTILADEGLTAETADSKVRGGAYAANGLNALFVKVANETGAAADGKFTTQEVERIGSIVQNNYGDAFKALHGDDDNGVETGVHLVVGNGGTSNLNLDGQARNAINTIFDGFFHYGEDVANGAFNNEDGNANQTVADVTNWLNALYFKAPE